MCVCVFVCGCGRAGVWMCGCVGVCVCVFVRVCARARRGAIVVRFECRNARQKFSKVSSLQISSSKINTVDS